MSVEGLLSEVKHFNAHNLDVALGEQLFFGGKRVFSDVKPGSSAEHKDNKKDGKGGKSELKTAIDGAKNTAQKALNQAGNSADVDTLREEHQVLAKKVEALASLVAELQLELSTLRQGKVNTVLILGDGNLSFSLAIATCNPKVTYYATVFDSREEYLRKYDAQDTLDELERLKNVVLVFSVDATALPTRWAGKFSSVIMNFPHPGGKTNLKKSKILLSGIFRSLRTILTSNANFRLSLAIGQSGIEKVDEEWMNQLPSHKKDSWQAIYLGADEGFVLESVENFDSKQFDSYKSSGYKETKKGFNTREGLTLTFKLCDNQDKTLSYLQDNKEQTKKALFHYYRPFHSQDLSFLFKDDETAGEKMALELVNRLAGNCLAEITEVESLRSMCPDPFLPNRIYRVVWQGIALPMGRNICSRIHEELRCRISESIIEENLPIVLT